jgi:hypothetical protein
MKNIIISDFDLTLNKKSILYSYLLLLLYLQCSSISDILSKYLKIVLLPIISLFLGLIYIFFSEYTCLTIINYYLFVGIDRSNLLSTIYLIKNLLINNLNPKVLDSIKSYNSNLKYIITGNNHDIVEVVLKDYDFVVSGSLLNYNKKNKKYTGFSDFLCLGKNKKIIIDHIINNQKKLGKTRKQIKLIAYGDSMNDYYMLKSADIRYVVGSDQTLINSLKKDKLKFNQLL